jgi:glycosyltransferase involved in cell wall biosynthesis
MKILLHDYAGHPFEAQLSRALARRGHEVLHAFAGGLQTPRGSLARREGDPDGLGFETVDVGEAIEKYSFLKRRRQERKYGRLITAVLKREQPQVLISANTPTEAQHPLARACHDLRIPLVSWVQDIYALAAKRILSRKIPVIGGLIGDYYIRLDAASMRMSSAAILISEDFRPQMHAWKIPDHRLTVIPNWAPLDEMPTRSRDNAFAREFGLVDKICLLYSGTLAMKHNPELLLHLARRFRNRPEIRIVLVSEGRAVEQVAETARTEGLTNLLTIPFQPMNRLSDVLATGDVLLAVLEPDAGEFSVPSKVLSYLCAGRPLLLSVPLNNLAARTTVNASAGFVAAPSDISGFVQRAQELVNDAALRQTLGSNARQYAEGNFQIDKITDQFEAVLTRITRHQGSWLSAELPPLAARIDAVPATASSTHPPAISTK